MRTGVLTQLHKIMQENKNVYLLTGDLGYLSLEKIEQDYPSRFINVGVAEQNMISMAAGLSLAGKQVFCYSIIPFLIMRPYEQIRNDLCYNNQNVTLLGIGAGMSYGILSSTHFALEDVAIMRVQPNMTVFSPADEYEAVEGIKSLVGHKGPVYFRIGNRKEPVVYQKEYNFKLGKGHIIQEGTDALIFASGPIIDEVLQAAKMAEKRDGVKAAIVDIHTIKPIDKELIVNQAKKATKIITVEEHNIIGGLGSAVLETLSEAGINKTVKILGTKDEFVTEVGSQKYLRKIKGLDAEGIYKTILNTL